MKNFKIFFLNFPKNPIVAIERIKAGFRVFIDKKTKLL